MKKFRICMILVMLAGVLLGGIGTGAAMVELSDMKYNGVVWYGTENLTKTKLVYEMKDRDTDQFFCYAGISWKEETEIIEDRKVPSDEIWFEIEYNPEYGEPVLEGYGAYENGDYKNEEVHIWRRTDQNEFEIIMKLKDQILEELKENKVSSYRFASVSGMKIYVHPQNKEKISIVR